MTSRGSVPSDDAKPSEAFLVKSEKKLGQAKVLRQRRRRRCILDKALICLGTGLLLIFLAVAVQFSWDDLLTEAVNKEFVLSNTSKSYDLWVKNVIPLYIDFYFFNWTNPKGIKSPSYKPAFEELGPYRFREEVEKVNIVWNENGTVTYNKRRKWFFVPEESSGKLNDTVVSLNVVAVAAAHTTKDWIPVARAPLSIALSGTQKVHVAKTVREFLFDGFDDPLIKLGRTIPGVSSRIPFDRFGWFYKRNGSADFDGTFNMDTGVNEMENFGKLTSWNYRNSTEYYNGQCGRVRGSAGEFWPPKRSKSDDIYLFTPDMCRYIGFKYEREISVMGLPGYRYNPGPLLFDNGTADPANKCFCNGECVPSGTVNVSSCKYGTPGFISYPHFHLGDPSYRDSVVGMRPDPEKHGMYIVLEPNLGVPLEVAGRLQINILLRPDPDISIYRGIPKIFFPILWFEQKVTLTDEMASSIKALLLLPTLTFVSYVTLYVVGFVFVVAYVTGKILARNRTDRMM